ncbi:hypothetical protein ACFLYA_02565 [Candidatus Dependentiae bacterium]
MKKIIISVILSSFICSSFLLSKIASEIIHISHDNMQDLDADRLELGKVVFYFSGKPIVNFVPSIRRNSKNKLFKSKKVFIFPKASIKDVLYDQLAKNINQKNPGYALKIKKIIRPIDGVKLSISYDPELVAVEYKNFQSLHNDQGVEFNFYNKKLINKIKRCEDNVLYMVVNDAYFFNDEEFLVV